MDVIFLFLSTFLEEDNMIAFCNKCSTRVQRGGKHPIKAAESVVRYQPLKVWSCWLIIMKWGINMWDYFQFYIPMRLSACLHPYWSAVSDAESLDRLRCFAVMTNKKRRPEQQTRETVWLYPKPSKPLLNASCRGSFLPSASAVLTSWWFSRGAVKEIS